MFWYLFGWIFPDNYVEDRCLECIAYFSTLVERAKKELVVLTRKDIRMGKDWIRWEKRAVDRGYITAHREDHGHCLMRIEGGRRLRIYALIETYAHQFWNKHRLWEKNPTLFPEMPEEGQLSRELTPRIAGGG